MSFRDTEEWQTLTAERVRIEHQLGNIRDDLAVSGTVKYQRYAEVMTHKKNLKKRLNAIVQRMSVIRKEWYSSHPSGPEAA